MAEQACFQLGRIPLSSTQCSGPGLLCIRVRRGRKPISLIFVLLRFRPVQRIVPGQDRLRMALNLSGNILVMDIVVVLHGDHVVLAPLVVVQKAVLVEDAIDVARAT